MCSHAGDGRMRLRAMVTEPKSVARYLRALGDKAEAPARAPARRSRSSTLIPPIARARKNQLLPASKNASRASVFDGDSSNTSALTTSLATNGSAPTLASSSERVRP